MISTAHTRLTHTPGLKCQACGGSSSAASTAMTAADQAIIHTTSASGGSVSRARCIQVVPSDQANAAPCIHTMPAGCPASCASSSHSSRVMPASTAATASTSRPVSRSR